METENKIIFYTQLLSQIEKVKEGIKIIDLEKKQESIEIIKKIKEKKKIEIWGATAMKKYPKNKILYVNDHINFTGNNPLIGKQKQIKIKFPDLSGLYQEKKEGIVTTSRGKHFLADTKHAWPTQYFCYFGIIARAIGIKQIKGYLINKDINTLKRHIFAKN